MKNNILEYKGYHTKIEFDSEDFVLRGKIEGINDLVNFESEDIKGIEKEFHEAVDDYLEFCREVGKEPDKEYKGSFNVRISPELHKKLAVTAMQNGDTLNASVEKAIEQYVLERNKPGHNMQTTVKIDAENLQTESIYQYDEAILQPGVISFSDIKMKHGDEKVN